MKFTFLACLLVLGFRIAEGQRVILNPPEFRLSTPWSQNVNPDNPLPEYPRPSMVREEWKSLNGRWYFALSDKDAAMPSEFRREIIVPFAVESALSGVTQAVGHDKKIWYKRTFFIPDSWSGRFVLLHFGACDWETTVFVNGREIGMHRGGYDSFSFDISPYLDERGVQEIVVSVWDPTDNFHQPRGKQKKEPKGIWYTPVSGIWQSVWIEPVQYSYIESFRITPDIDQPGVYIQTKIENAVPGDSIIATARFKGALVAKMSFLHDSTGFLPIANPKLWSPETPELYDVTLELVRKDLKLDSINTYTGMRKISVSEDRNGHKRIFLNGKPVFQFGLLDQGWWPDGLYTAPTDQALQFDILRTKELGYNVIRKHVKVESDRWYWHCDRLGILVWQDMPNSDVSAPWKAPSGIDGEEIKREFVSEAQYKIEYEAMVNYLYNHPSVIKWIPFNEGWGQFKTKDIYAWAATLDSTRLLGGPSGGNYFPVGHTRDHHRYPGPEMPPADPDRALILGEFGGLGLPLEGHLWQTDQNWGYITIQTQKELITSYTDLINKLKVLISQGLAGAIYTQTTDVEGEVNGVMTYDRRVIKIKNNKVKKAHKSLFDQHQTVVR